MSLRDTLLFGGIFGAVAVYKQFEEHPAETAGVLWVLLGVGMVIALLTAVFFNTGIAGHRRPSGAHGFLGILSGYILLIFATAFLYNAGFVFWFSLFGGIVVSVLIKVLFAHWRKSSSGSEAPEPEPEMSLIYHRQELRRE